MINTDTETQKHRNTETQKHRNTETQKHRNTETQKHRNTETQKHRKMSFYKHHSTTPFQDLSDLDMSCIKKCSEITQNSDSPDNQLKLGAMLLFEKGVY